MRLLRYWMAVMLTQVAFTGAFAGDDHLYPVTLDDRIQHSSLIIEGKVYSQTSFWDQAHKNIYTSNLVRVYRVFKGTTSISEIEVITEGGRVGKDAEVLSSTLSLHKDQLGILFCMPGLIKSPGRSAAETSFMVYSSLQGFIKYDPLNNRASDPFTTYSNILTAVNAVKNKTGKDVQISVNEDLLPPVRHKEMQPLSSPAISGLIPSTIPAGTGSILTINGNNFGTSQGGGFVQFKNANTGGNNFAMNYEYIRPLPSDYILWTNNQIRVKVPSCSTTDEPAGTGTIQVVTNDFETATSGNILTIPFGQINFNFFDTSYPMALVNDNGSGGYTFQQYTAFAANTTASAAFVRAMNSWICSTGVNWIIGANTTVNEIAADGVSVIRFDENSELPVGILGRCTSRLSICQTASPTFYVTEIDLTFDDNPHYPWQFGPASPTSNQYDFESVALHELGHAQQLCHVIAPGAVMHFSVNNGQQSRALGSNDINGGHYIMTRSMGYDDPCGTTGMQPRSCSVLPVTILSFTGHYSQNSGTLLQWKTSDETGIKDYTVLRSLDGNSFKEIGRVVPNLQSSSNTYQFKDIFTSVGKWQYKLLIHQVDGSSKYSEIVIIAANSAALPEFTLSPNPAKNKVILSAFNLDMRGSSFEMFTLDSRKVYSQFFANAPATCTREIRVDQLPKGMYVYIFTTGTGERFMGKVMID